MHTKKSQTLSYGYMPVALTLSSFASLTTIAYTCTHTHTNFQGDLVTFPVCPILPLSVLSVTSLMPSCLELLLPLGQIRTTILGQQKKKKKNPCQCSKHHRCKFTTSLTKQRH